MVLGELNQAGALSITGLKLPGAHSFFIGNPTTGKMFFEADPAAGAVIPIRMYVWQNKAGKSEIGYFEPAPLLGGVDPTLATPAKKLSMMATKIAEGAAGASPTAGSAVSTSFVTVTSSKSFAETVEALKHSVSGAGMMVLGELNQAGALSITGLKLPGAESLFVGNPTTGKMFFEADPAAGAVIPIRMYVWQNKAGKSEIGYFEPASLLGGVNPKLATPAKKLSMMAAQIAKGAS
jgi:uncharacterized protein (DUF302 family)